MSSSHPRRAASACVAALPVLVPLALSAVLAAAEPPWPVSVVALAGGVAWVARRRGREPGAYTALLSSAALAAVRARQAGAGSGASGRLLVGSTITFLCCALVTDRHRPRHVSRLHEPAPVPPYEPGGRSVEPSILYAFLARRPIGPEEAVGRLADGPSPEESRHPCPTPSSGS